jgi:hypothetical protein
VLVLLLGCIAVGFLLLRQLRRLVGFLGLVLLADFGASAGAV